MRIVKQMMAVLAAVVLVFSCTMAAFAGVTGTITVNNAKEGQTYSLYRLLDLESYNTTNDAYAYKVADGWEDFFAQSDIADNYVTIDNQGYVTWKGSADQVVFAQKAAAYGAEHGIDPVDQKTAGAPVDGKLTVTFEDLPLGYYLMDSSMGALCSLDTTNPQATMEEKNFEPMVEKKVNRGGEAYGDSNTAKIGDTVMFRTVVTADKGAQNYVVHDAMSAGLTFGGIPEEVKAGGEPGIYYRHSGSTDAEYPLVAGSDYTLDTHPEDGCTFHVVFAKSFLDGITDKIYINIHYTATLNSEAVMGDGGNTNETHLSYGDSQTTETDQTKTYSYLFDLVKVDGGKRVLSGATFKLYDAKTGGNEICLVDLGSNTYRIATAEEKAVQGFQGATIKAGVATVEGLSNGTYYLEEIDPPAGYNRLDGRATVTIADANNKATLNGDKTQYVSGGVSVVNQSGTILPSTGDMGALIFYLVGGIAVASALLVLANRARKRKGAR